MIKESYLSKVLSEGVAKKSKPCNICQTVWNEGDKIFFMKDPISGSRSYDIICETCGEKIRKAKGSGKVEVREAVPLKAPTSFSLPPSVSTMMIAEILEKVKRIEEILSNKEKND